MKDKGFLKKNTYKSHMGACVVYGCSPVLGALLVSHRKEYKVFCKNFSKYFSVSGFCVFCCLAEFALPIPELRFRVAD